VCTSSPPVGNFTRPRRMLFAHIIAQKRQKAIKIFECEELYENKKDLNRALAKRINLLY